MTKIKTTIENNPEAVTRKIVRTVEDELSKRIGAEACAEVRGVKRSFVRAAETERRKTKKQKIMEKTQGKSIEYSCVDESGKLSVDSQKWLYSPEETNGNFVACTTKRQLEILRDSLKSPKTRLGCDGSFRASGETTNNQERKDFYQVYTLFLLEFHDNDEGCEVAHTGIPVASFWLPGKSGIKWVYVGCERNRHRASGN